jgi:hypothetical protein
MLWFLVDILMALGTGNLAALVLVDLSAAFDTVDRGILLRPIRTSYGLRGARRRLGCLTPKRSPA